MDERSQERHDILNFLRDMPDDLEAWQIKLSLRNYLVEKNLNDTESTS